MSWHCGHFQWHPINFLFSFLPPILSFVPFPLLSFSPIWTSEGFFKLFTVIFKQDSSAFDNVLTFWDNKMSHTHHIHFLPKSWSQPFLQKIPFSKKWYLETRILAIRSIWLIIAFKAFVQTELKYMLLKEKRINHIFSLTKDYRVLTF